jgi:hypothetical protein
MTGAIRATGEVSYTELDRSDRLALLWGFLWRGVCVTLASSLAGLVAGFVIGLAGGLVAAAVGVPIADYALGLRVAAGLVGLGIGLGFLVVYVRWLLRARLGSLRLALIRCA